MAEDHDLEVLVDIGFPTKHKEFDETLEYYIKEGEHHGRGFSQPGRLIDHPAGSAFRHRVSVPHALRLVVVPTDESGERLFVVVGSSLQGRHEVLAKFLLLLLIGGPLALALASLAGWALAGAALRPVDRMGEEAAAVSVSERGRRLPVPDTRDEIARLGARLNSMLDRLHVAFDRERQFVDDASHELHTPLTILKAELDLALSRPRTSRELESALRSASEETDRLAALAEDLLLYSRAEGGRIPVHRTNVELDDLLHRAVSGHARRAEAAGVSIA